MNELSLADVAALRGNNDGFGGNDGWWIILLFMFMGWGNRGWGNGGAGSAGGNELYPWLNQTDIINGGFRDQMLQSGISGIQQSITTGFANAANQLCNCCSEMQMALANGFFGVETSANARQMANMQQQFAMQTAMMQGFNAQQAQQAQDSAAQQLGMAQQTATILAEHCSDRAALSDGVRDIIAAQGAGTQAILDKLCALELQGVQRELDAERRTNDSLRTQIAVLNNNASQTAQTAQLIANNEAQTAALERYLAPNPVPAYIVQNPNCCGQTYGCGCAA